MSVNNVYTERAVAAVLAAKMAIAAGFEAGLGLDDNTHWPLSWRMVLYVDFPEGQISWHISPTDQHLLHGLPAYPGKWDGKWESKAGDRVASWDSYKHRPRESGDQKRP